MSISPKLPPAGAQIVPFLLPFLAVVVLGCVAVADRSSSTPAAAGPASPLTASSYAPEAYTPRFLSIWTMLLRVQYKAVDRCSDAVLASKTADEKLQARAEYLVCLREYNRLATCVPVAAFAGQRLPRHLAEMPFPNPDDKPLG